MSTIGRYLPMTKPTFWLAATGFCLSLLALVWSTTSLWRDRPSDAGTLTVALPERIPAVGGTIRTIVETGDGGGVIQGELANPAVTQPSFDPLSPVEPDLELVDASPLGPLPRIADDGRWPLQTYARPHDAETEGPKIAILVTGLGLQADATNATFHLPGAISLMFSPYSEDLPSLFERARLAGHEVMVELPMEPADYPASDPGPHTLRASGTVDTNLERLTWLLSRAQGYFAVGGRGGAFAESPEALPVMQALADRGVGMIEVDGSALAAGSESSGLAYLSASNWIDSTPTAAAIDQALTDLEVEAREEGSALGVAEAYPVTLQRLVDWTAALEQRGVSLVPVSAILIERSGRLSGDNQASNIAQSEN